MKTYDDNNIFAKILRGEIPNDTVYEDDHVLAFRDINPQAPVHVLVIPKGAYVDMTDFSANASDAELTAYFRALAKIANLLEAEDDGYRLISNTGKNGEQDVPHLHVHIAGGRRLRRMLQPSED